MKVSLLLITAAFTGVLAAQPVVPAGGILNVASYSFAGLPNSGIAQGSLFVIFGERLGPATPLSSLFPLGANLGGTTVSVTPGGGTARQVPVVITSATQVVALLPSDFPIGPATLTLSFNGASSTPRTFQVVQSSFGIFAMNEAGSGPGAIQNITGADVPPINSVLNPARAGMTVTLWGTGLGPVTGAEIERPLPGDRPEYNVEVFVGGRPARVTYRGRSGCCAGVDQINFVVPQDIEGCYVPVAVKIADVVSNFTTMAIGPGNRCQDTTSGFSGDDLDRARQNGLIRTGAINLTRFALPLFPGVSLTVDLIRGIFARYPSLQFERSAGPLGLSFHVGACTMFAYRGDIGLPEDPVRGLRLDAGPQLTLAGSTGSRPVPKNAGGTYTATLSDFLNAGRFTISGPGGSGNDTVGSFQVQVDVPPTLNWTNAAQVDSITRANGQIITWSGGNPESLVNIIGFANTAGVGIAFSCTERISAGRFTIPASVLLAMPRNSDGFLLVGATTAPVRFSAAGLDAGVATASLASSKGVTFR